MLQFSRALITHTHREKIQREKERSSYTEREREKAGDQVTQGQKEAEIRNMGVVGNI